MKFLKVRDNNVFKNEVIFNLSEPDEKFSNNSPYFTLIIGPNGTGKSNLLKLIIEIFRLAYQKKNLFEITQYPSGKYYFEYFLNDGYYTILNTLGWANGVEKPSEVEDEKNEKGIRFFKNGTEIKPLELELPQSINALSIMLTDKYPLLKDNSKFQIYNYLGIRKDSNSAGTRTYINRTINSIFEASKNKSFVHDLKELLEFLGLDKEFYVSYSPRYKHIFFNGKLTLEIFESYFNDYKKFLKRETEPWSIKVFKAIQRDEPEIISELVELINFLSSRLEYWYDGGRAQYFEFDIFDGSIDVKNMFKLLPYLNRLDLISYPSIVLNKNKNYFDFAESSSGEYHFISSIIGLLAGITKNSVIFIDEPEISLHPNWQMKYIHFMKEIFKKHSSTHFIICTHSHFMVSDLKNENSTIISLNKTIGGEVKATTIKSETYGWSAEQILLEVFQVSTSRNYFIAERIGQILKKASLNANLDEYKDELMGYRNGLREEDPLHYTITKIAERLQWLD